MTNEYTNQEAEIIQLKKIDSDLQNALQKSSEKQKGINLGLIILSLVYIVIISMIFIYTRQFEIDNPYINFLRAINPLIVSIGIFIPTYFILNSKYEIKFAQLRNKKATTIEEAISNAERLSKNFTSSTIKIFVISLLSIVLAQITYHVIYNIPNLNLYLMIIVMIGFLVFFYKGFKSWFYMRQEYKIRKKYNDLYLDIFSTRNDDN